MRIRLVALAVFGVLELAPLSAFSTDLIDLAAVATPDQIRDALKNGADPNAVDSVGRTVLMLAASSNTDPTIITLLVKAGARVNARGPEGWTALMFAAYANTSPDVVAALLSAGANAKMRSNAGGTAFDYGSDNEKLKGSAVYGRLR